MKTRYEELAKRLGECFAPLNDAIAAEVLAGLVSSAAATVGAYEFQFSAETLRHLLHVLASDDALFSVYCGTVAGNRERPDRLLLIHQALTVGRWESQRERLEAALAQVLLPALRQRFSRYLNDLDGALALQRDALDAGGFAQWINETAGVPVVDGLQLKGLAWTFAEHPGLWQEFGGLLSELRARRTHFLHLPVRPEEPR